MLTGSHQRTEPHRRLIGSIVIDCTAVRPAARTPDRPLPVVVTWDEYDGWCAGMHDGPTRSTRSYLHRELLPPPAAVADFVVGLALGQPLGDVLPMIDRPRLRLFR